MKEGKNAFLFIYLNHDFSIGGHFISFINRLDTLVSFTCAFILFHIVNFFFHINKRVVNDRIK